jgi:hypothetical protein
MAQMNDTLKDVFSNCSNSISTEKLAVLLAGIKDIPWENLDSLEIDWQVLELEGYEKLPVPNIKIKMK